MNEEENILRKILEKLELIRTLNIKGNMSPHKYIFLLMIAKLYEKDPFRENCFYFNDFLEKNYIKLWIEKRPGIKYGNIFTEYPFYHLSNDGVWNLKIKAIKPRLSKTLLIERYFSISIDNIISNNNLIYEIITKIKTELKDTNANVSNALIIALQLGNNFQLCYGTP